MCAYRANTAYCANIVTMYRTSHEKLFAFDCPALSQSELMMLTLRVFFKEQVYVHAVSTMMRVCKAVTKCNFLGYLEIIFQERATNLLGVVMSSSL